MTTTAASAAHQHTLDAPVAPAGALAFQHALAPVHRTVLDPSAHPHARLDAMSGYIPANEQLVAQVYLDRLLDGLEEVRGLGLEHGTRLLDYVLAAHVGTALEDLAQPF